MNNLSFNLLLQLLYLLTKLNNIAVLIVMSSYSIQPILTKYSHFEEKSNFVSQKQEIANHIKIG